MTENKKSGSVGTITKGETNTKEKIEPPKMWKVIFHNDDFTPFIFVAQMLMRHFHKTNEEALEITKKIHEGTSVVVGVFTHEVAETKTTIVNLLARQNEFPFQATMEPE